MGGEVSLPTLLELFRRHREKASGALRVGGEGGRTIYMDAGDIVFAQSGAPEDRLTAILVERGKLTQAQMDYALANLKPGLSIGKNLIEMGFITQRDLLDTARAQVERIVWRAMANTLDSPAFEAKDLEPTIVRLPLDTPSMLLAGLLSLGDRERVLDLLGPVNQVVLLEGKRSYELVLPQDLTKILSLLDGTRTILELSRDSGIEPFRLGAFCLFLREMGWGRLHELPPLDRGALEQALLPEPEPLSPQLPEPTPGPALMAAIEAAARPTTNLDHMAAALDALPDPISAPTPATPLAAFPEAEEDPSLSISEASSISLIPPTPITEPAGKTRRILPFILLGILGITTGIWWLKTRRKPVSPAPPSPSVLSPQPTPVQADPPREPDPASVHPASTPGPEAQASAPAKPAPKAAPAAEEPTRANRLAAIRGGDWDRALALGEAHREKLSNHRWTLRLEVACMGSTVQNATSLLDQKEPDLWLIPIRMRDGKTCYQVLLGDYANKTAAEAAAKRLPKLFKTPGNRPRAFKLSDLPDKQ